MSAHATRISRARRELIAHLKRAGALSDDRAQSVEPVSSLERSVLKRMLAREVIRAGSRGGYWLDQERYAEWKRQQLLIGLGMSLVMAGIVACLALNEPSDSGHRAPRGGAVDSTADSVTTPPPR